MERFARVIEKIDADIDKCRMSTENNELNKNNEHDFFAAACFIDGKRLNKLRSLRKRLTDAPKEVPTEFDVPSLVGVIFDGEDNLERYLITDTEVVDIEGLSGIDVISARCALSMSLVNLGVGDRFEYEVDRGDSSSTISITGKISALQ